MNESDMKNLSFETQVIHGATLLTQQQTLWQVHCTRQLHSDLEQLKIWTVHGTSLATYTLGKEIPH